MAASNYDDVVDQLAAAGLVIKLLMIGPTPSGKPWRCPVEGEREKRGWYLLHEIEIDGDAVLVGAYGIYRGDDPGTTKITLKNRVLTAEQRAAIRARQVEDNRRMKALVAAASARAARRAESVWRKCTQTGDCDYLARKGVQAHGVRFTPSGAMVIPMMDTACRVHGLQFVLGRATHAERIKRDGKDKRYWPFGCTTTGHFHLIGMPTWIVLVAEGYATAATLHEATGLPVAVAFDANNLLPVSEALHKRYPRARLLICADDDACGKCVECKTPVRTGDPTEICANCGKPHGRINPGRSRASAAALAVGGQWIAPKFADPDAIWQKFVAQGHKTTDFNDLHAAEGLTTVRSQIEAALRTFGWTPPDAVPGATTTRGAGADNVLRPIDTLDELLERYALIYGEKEVVFDRAENMIVSLTDMRNICISRELHRRWMEHPAKAIVRMSNVGFDPTEKDAAITCNTYAGWPTTPKPGSCEMLLELLAYLCSAEENADAVYTWLLKWLAYPIQFPGAKMQSAVVIHGPQGTGKSLVFKAICGIYGRYSLTINQAAVENHRNTWLSSRLFILAEEVVARQELYQVKNALKDLVTGDTVYVDPKFVNAYAERNHVNLVFLSNEAMPLVLEDDDRRHLVVSTPKGGQPADFYLAVKREINDGGGAALHAHLLALPLGDFDPHTRPPMTASKAALQDLALDSTSRFYRELISGDIDGVRPGTAALGTDVFDLYRTWCHRIGVKPAPMPRLLNALEKKHGIDTARKRYLDGQTVKGPHGVCYIPRWDSEARRVLIQPEKPVSESDNTWHGACITAFRNAVKDYKGAANG